MSQQTAMQCTTLHNPLHLLWITLSFNVVPIGTASDRHQVDAITISSFIRQIMPKMSTIHRYSLPIWQTSDNVPVHLLVSETGPSMLGGFLDKILERSAPGSSEKKLSSVAVKKFNFSVFGCFIGFFLPLFFQMDVKLAGWLDLSRYHIIMSILYLLVFSLRCWLIGWAQVGPMIRSLFVQIVFCTLNIFFKSCCSFFNFVHS